MTKYTISRYDGSNWIWAGDGDTANGCLADIPDKVLEMADEGKDGDIDVDGTTYRIELRDNQSKYDIRDPFAGEMTIEGETLEQAIEDTYKDIPTEERPAYVWYHGEKIPVPNGTCSPE